MYNQPKILSRNVNGEIAERLKPDAALMIDIILHEPHVVVMQDSSIPSISTVKRLPISNAREGP